MQQNSTPYALDLSVVSAPSPRSLGLLRAGFRTAEVCHLGLLAYQIDLLLQQVDLLLHFHAALVRI